MSLEDQKHTQESYPPWSIAEVAFFYFIISFFVYLGISFLAATFASDIFGASTWSEIIANPHNPESQIYHFVNYFLTSIIMMILLYIRVCKRYNMSFKEGFRIKKPENFNYFYVIPIIAFMLFIVFMMRDFKPEDITKIPIYSRISTKPGLVFFILMGITIAPVFEELFYRGYLYPAIEQAWNSWIAILLVSIFFTIAHVGQLWGDWAGMFVIFGVGAILTTLRAQTNSTSICIIVHFGYNASVTLINFITYLLKR